MCCTGLVLPNNKTGNNCAQKSISQDGSHVPEKVPLKDIIKGNNFSHLQDDEAFTRHREFKRSSHKAIIYATVNDDCTRFKL